MTEADHGPKPELAWLPIVKCDVDRRYQRGLESRRSQELITLLAEQWRWASCGCLLAVRAGARFTLIDGQHRAEAARRIGITHLPALVIAELSLEDQAKTFVRANLDRVTVNPFALHHARLVAGDENARLIDRICRAAGITIPRYAILSDNLAPGQTMALASIAALAKRLGEGGASAVLTAIAEAYRDKAGCLRASLMKAVGAVYEAAPSTKEREAALARVAEWLRKTPPADLFAKAMRRKANYRGTDADNLAAVIKAGIGFARSAPGPATPLGPSTLKPPTKAQLMGRR
jgi:hypothetical protein